MLGTFIENTKKIHKNTAREARREIVMYFFTKYKGNANKIRRAKRAGDFPGIFPFGIQEIQIIMVREARREMFWCIFIGNTKGIKQNTVNTKEVQIKCGARSAPGKSLCFSIENTKGMHMKYGARSAPDEFLQCCVL